VTRCQLSLVVFEILRKLEIAVQGNPRCDGRDRTPISASVASPCYQST